MKGRSQKRSGSRPAARANDGEAQIYAKLGIKKRATPSRSKRSSSGMKIEKCPLGMKCQDPNCEKQHPACKDSGNCKNPKCGFQHPDGHRYTKSQQNDTAKSLIKPVKTTMCWKKHKCDDINCSLIHPNCRAGDSCKNTKCGFLHPNGWRYIGGSVLEHAPIIKTSAGGVSLCHETSNDANFVYSEGNAVHSETSSIHSGANSGHSGANSVYYRESSLHNEIDSVNNESSIEDRNIHTPLYSEVEYPGNIKSPVVTSSSSSKEQPKLHEHGKTVKARGEVIHIDSDNNVWIKPILHYFAKHPEFFALASNSSTGIRLALKNTSDVYDRIICDAISIGDLISVQIYIDGSNNLVAESPRFVKIKKGSRTCNDFIKLLDVAIGSDFLHKDILMQILNFDGASHLVVGKLLRKTHFAWIDCSQIRQARKLRSLFVSSTFLTPHGSFNRQISMLSKEECYAGRDMLGCICMLGIEDACILVRASTLLASYLPGPDGVKFLSGMLQASLPLRKSDSLSHFDWFQLPSVPMGQDILNFTNPYGITDLKNLPEVFVGRPYPNMETYLSTYMRLHRADCFLTFVSQIQQDFLGRSARSRSNDSTEMELVVGNSISVCGMNVSRTTGEIDVQLGCTILDSSKLRHNTFALTNTICISLQGDFKDDSLIWGTVTASPKQRNISQPRASIDRESSQLRVCRILFCVSWCRKVNSLSDNQIFTELQKHQKTACLVENSVSFVLFEPVMDALRSMWRPGQPLRIPFAKSLLQGKSEPASDTANFRRIGNELGIVAGLDEYQREAFEHVAEEEFALIQGPPGCGKSYLGSRLARVLAESSGRVLVVTNKNHALDEMMIDIADTYGSDGISKIVRVGNTKKMSKSLVSRSLQTLLSSGGWSSEESTTTSKDLNKIANRCNMKCKLLQKDIQLNAENFVRYTGSNGINTIYFLLGRSCSQDMNSFVHDSTVDIFLSSWAISALQSLKDESREYWKIVDPKCVSEMELEQQNWAKQQDEANDAVADFDGLSEMNPDSLLGTMIAHGMTGDNAESLPEMDVSSMLNWGLESKRIFLLAVLYLEFRSLTDSFSELASELDTLYDNARESRLVDERSVLCSVPVIGSTVLGVLLNMDSISAAKPTVLLIEEAGEVPEAALIAILRMPSLQRCVMVGDHQQLRPATNSYDLCVHKKLDISCFERLVHLNIRRSVLKTQNRMREDVLAPVLQHYPGIVSNQALIQHLIPVPWLTSPLFWWVCEERACQMKASWYNEEEGERAACLASFLASQGATNEANITILVPYTSQLFNVRVILRRKGNLDVNVSTIDQYQGDENDIIILSLVRCDPDNPGKLGFLGQTNRLIVSTSRQKRALIIVGSERCFSTNPEWKNLQKTLSSQHDGDNTRHARISSKLPLCCPRHSQKKLLVPCSRSFPSSGCGAICGMPLGTCAHKCTLKCHPIIQSHGLCKEMVLYTHKDCKHSFQYQCHAIPKLCPKEVQITLKCGHKKNVTCGMMREMKEMKCSETSETKLPCGHCVWLCCGTSIEGFVSEDFNACPSCILQCLEVNSNLSCSLDNVKTPEIFKTADWINTAIPCTAEQIKQVADAVARSGLAEIEFSAFIESALCNAKVPSSIIKSSIPSDKTWDPSVRIEERRHHLELFSKQQQLWRVLLQESGVSVPLEWQKHPLGLVAGLALACVENKRTFSCNEKTDAELFFSRLQLLGKKKIDCSHDLIEILKDADKHLYQAIVDSSARKSWYEIEEGNLAKAINARLVAATASATTSGQDNGGDSHVRQRVMRHLSNMESHPDNWKEQRSCWGLDSDVPSDIHSPPYQEIPHEFLYRAGLAGSHYISLDLKSADFHVLRLAAPLLIQQGTWASWLQKVIPDSVEKLPFVTELKPLRVRVLGKVLHKKNAALQSHCLRILVRLLLILADSSENTFDPIERIFQFSCDELCIKLKNKTTHSAAYKLSHRIRAFLDQMNWQQLLPVRIEFFELVRVPYDANIPKHIEMVTWMIFQQYIQDILLCVIHHSL